MTITARELHRLVDHITAGLLVDLVSQDANREALIEFAGLHELDIQDTATLYRVASGERIESGDPIGPFGPGGVEQ